VAERKRNLADEAFFLVIFSLLVLLERFDYILSDTYFSVIDSQVKAAIRICADPSLIHHRSTISAVIR
jgi:hypothetical protein